MKRLKLTPRLQAVADKIAPGAAVADVGTDHGYIPAYLAQSGAARRIIAADVREGPLLRARETAYAYGVADQIDFRLTDGLDGIVRADADTVVLAGLGGETMLAILSNAPWTREDDVTLVLQPQTKLDELSAYLTESSFGLFDAQLVLDDGRLYTVFSAGTAAAEPFDPLVALLRRRDVLLPVYVNEQIVKYQRALDGLSRSASGHEGAAQLREKLRRLEHIKGEIRQWQQ